MLIRNGGTLVGLGMILLIALGSAYAQQKVYKWVDEDGVVHFGDEPPAESGEAEVEIFTTDPPPKYVPPVEPQIQSPSTSETVARAQPAQQEPQALSTVEEINIRELSLAELDLRCEAARQEKIAPLKAAEIENCVQTGTGDQDWCETFWADYGAPRRRKSGGMTPAMFLDLPECVEAFEETNRRGLNPGD